MEIGTTSIYMLNCMFQYNNLLDLNDVLACKILSIVNRYYICSLQTSSTVYVQYLLPSSSIAFSKNSYPQKEHYTFSVSLYMQNPVFL